MNARRTRWAMVGIGVALWVFAVALPGMHVSILVFSAVLVAFAAYGLLADARDGATAGPPDPPR